jgi:uncharacterized membrane protein
MRLLLFAISVVVFLIAVLLALVGPTPLHQIHAAILFVVSSVCLAGAGIVEAINMLRQDMVKTERQ